MRERRLGADGSSGGPAERASPHQVEMQVVHGLAAPLADVRDDPVARLRDALRPRDLGGGGEDPPKQPGVLLRELVRGRDVITRDEQDVRRRSGAMSRKAMMASSSATRFDGISP